MCVARGRELLVSVFLRGGEWRREEGGKGDRRVQALIFGLNLRLDLN